MPIDAFITLDRLECSKETDESGHSEPYIWPLLLRIDDHTLSTDARVGSLSAADNFARVVIKQGMKRGDSAAIPNGLRSFGLRFDDNLAMNHVVVVVVLMEEDDLPDRAVQHGYAAFRSALPNALRDLSLLARLASNDPVDSAAAMQEVVDQVAPAVKAAISDGLTAGEKLRVLLGLLDLDDQIAFATVRFDRLLADGGATLDRPFDMRLLRRTGTSNQTVTDLYTLRGRFQTRRVVIDRCKALVDRVRAAQEEIAGFEAEIAELKKQFKGAELKALIDLIRRDDLDPAVAALEAAQRDLAKCRAAGSLGGVVGPLTQVLAQA